MGSYPWGWRWLGGIRNGWGGTYHTFLGLGSPGFHFGAEKRVCGVVGSGYREGMARMGQAWGGGWWGWLLGRLRGGRGEGVAEHIRMGRWGEEVAVARLKREGYVVIGRNVRFGGQRELDAVAWEKGSGTLVFVEVRARRDERFGRPVESIGKKKRLSIGRAGWCYLRRLKRRPAHFRFDVVEVIGRPGEGEPVVRHLENVFTLPKGFRVPW